MAIFAIFKDKISSKCTPKRTKLHHFKKFCRGSMPPNPPKKPHGFATCNFPNLKKKYSSSPPPLPNPGDAPDNSLLCRSNVVVKVHLANECIHYLT